MKETISFEQFEQSVLIAANAVQVERCFTDRTLMHQWLNPVLRCDPVGEWSTDLGSQTRFVIQIPLLEPSLTSVVVERQPGLVVWQFQGFFEGRDRWQCLPQGENHTQLLNRFEFVIPNPIVAFGFRHFAATWTKRDMEAQLQRLKVVAESLV